LATQPSLLGFAPAQDWLRTTTRTERPMHPNVLLPLLSSLVSFLSRHGEAER
jgi:hypothetical protein